MEGGCEMTKEGAMEIICEGTKYFHGTESLFHIALVDHTLLDTIEVISYEKRNAVETSRIYLNYSVLLSRIGEESIEARYRSIKEQAMKNHAIPDLTRMRKLATSEVIFDFVLQRLFSNGGSTAKTLMLEFKLLNKDLVEPRRVGYHVRDLVCEKPYSLQEFGFNSDTFSSGLSLSAKQKWRIPIVLAKVAKGRQLSVCDTKIWESVSRGVADGEVETEGFEPAPPVEEVVVAHTRVPFAGRQDKKPKRIEHNQEAITKVAGTGPIKEKLLGRQQSVRKGSFSVGLDALTSSLQRSLNAVRGISMDASHKPRGDNRRHLKPPADSSTSLMSGTSPKSPTPLVSSPRTPHSATVHLTAPMIPPVASAATFACSGETAAATAHGGDGDRGFRRGSRALQKGVSANRLTRGDSHRWSDSATPTNSRVASARLTADTSGSFSVKYAGASVKGGGFGASTKYGQSTKREKVFSCKMSDMEPYISPCERANRELKAARLIAKLNANAAGTSCSELSDCARTGANSFGDDEHTPPAGAPAAAHKRTVQFPADGSAAAPTPRRARTRNPPPATQHLFPRSAMVEDIVSDERTTAIKQKPGTGASVGAVTLGDAVLQPVLRLLQMVTRRSISAVVPGE